MILIPYLFSGLYAVRIAISREGYRPGDAARVRDLLIGGAATLYCCWLLYAAGPKYLFLSALLYAPGLLVYAWAKREQRAKLFQPFEIVIALALLALAVAAAWMLATGRLGL